jgi:hypothetical protein
MTKDDWLELTVLEKKKYNYLVEIEDITRQLAESLDRNDQVSARMLVAMRQDPIRLLAEISESARARQDALPEEGREALRELLAGTAASGDGQRIFQEQAGKTRRLLEQVVAMDRRVSLRMAGEHSFYQTGRSG